ncbi:uncharacterized protein LOC120253096 isoform X1 [Dioscorea cayenensis subsp. rotundata]|uniref:Uncharacterized protein LOC120253096 isoform X1 n=2 Tax=Dioscorea cayennensis subsp. rotundata TaxID=55577 RepID=A0AB40ARM7_DIOCR|nr:uncharacterized protein LOC120253096 isoform X1 [Dioscorea cayenensis subsp. rotundata]
MDDEMEEKKKFDGEPEGPEPSQPSFLEVLCKSSGKMRRFAAGTESGFAIFLINRKFEPGNPHALHIEAVKDGEEPVCFGPNAVLVNYGKGWRLQTVIDEGMHSMHRKGFEEMRGLKSAMRQRTSTINPSEIQSAEKPIAESSIRGNCEYFGRILLAFAFIFLLGGTLTVFLEKLPELISFVSSAM